MGCTRTANITYQPLTSKEFPWNVGLYDLALPKDGGYTESRGAESHAEAIRIADDWVYYRNT